LCQEIQEVQSESDFMPASTTCGFAFGDNAGTCFHV